MVSNKSEFKEIFVEIVSNRGKVVNQFKREANLVLSNLNQHSSMIHADVECAVSHVILQMLLKIDAGNLKFKENVGDKQATVMAIFKQYVKYYLLKRYARRSLRKPKGQYLSELKTALPGQKVSRYKGGRFDATGNIDDFADCGAEEIEDEYALERQQLIKVLLATEISNRDAKILSYRLEKYSYEEIAELIATTKTGIPATKHSIRAEHTRAMKEAGLDLSCFKIYTRDEIDPDRHSKRRKIEFV